MIDLKPYYDAVVSTEAEVQRIASEIDAQFRLETEEGKAKALAMQPELEAAQKKHEEAVKVYENLQKANRPNEVAKNFVPVSTTSLESQTGNQPKVMLRKEWLALDAAARMKFIKDGGTLEDEPAE